MIGLFIVVLVLGLVFGVMWGGLAVENTRQYPVLKE